MSNFHVCILITYEIFVITAYDDQLLSVMSNQHTELYKCMIGPNTFNFLQQDHHFLVLALTHCML